MIAVTHALQNYRMGLVCGAFLGGGLASAVAIAVGVHRAETRNRDERRHLEALERLYRERGRR